MEKSTKKTSVGRSSLKAAQHHHGLFAVIYVDLSSVSSPFFHPPSPIQNQDQDDQGGSCKSSKQATNYRRNIVFC
jgi:hypothetical protein